MSNRLDFLNIPEAENFVTVRFGQNWQIKTQSDLDVDIYQTGDTQPLAKGRVMSVSFCPIKNIPLHSLALEHDPACRTVTGLVECLRECYNDKTINEYSQVTVMKIYAPSLKKLAKPAPEAKPVTVEAQPAAESEVTVPQYSESVTIDNSQTDVSVIDTNNRVNTKTSKKGRKK